MGAHLNPAQLRAVNSTAKTIAVVASPGSGKTKTLVERIRARAYDYGTRPTRVVLTYTNAAAHELAERMELISCEYLGTLHGYCFRLLQRYGHAIGYRKGGVTLVTEDVAEELLAEAARELGWRKSRRALDDRGRRDVDLIWLEYAHRLKRNNLVDYDTVLEAGHRLLTHPEVRELERYEELYVDEAQDSALIDWHIYRAFNAEWKFICGDGDQSIYGFRGAFPEGFTKFAREAEERITLDLNYRSGDGICMAASRLIRHNGNRIEKDVVAADPRASVISVIPCPSDLHERNAVANHIIADNLDPSTVAILCRTNALADQFREALQARGIPVAGGARQQLPRDWQRAINVLNLWLDPRNDIIAARVISDMAPEQLGRAKDAAVLDGDWLSVEAARLGILPAHFTSTLALVPEYLPRYGVGPEMCDIVAGRVKLLPQRDPTLTDLLHDLFQYASTDQTTAGADGVFVGTIHSAKGKEWPVVFLPAFEEGICPSLRKDSDLSEERRLAYTAITRAADELHISYAEKRTAWGKTTDQKPSRFITEAAL